MSNNIPTKHEKRPNRHKPYTNNLDCDKVKYINSLRRFQAEEEYAMSEMKAENRKATRKKVKFTDSIFFIIVIMMLLYVGVCSSTL